MPRSERENVVGKFSPVCVPENVPGVKRSLGKGGLDGGGGPGGLPLLGLVGGRLGLRDGRFRFLSEARGGGCGGRIVCKW